jgi:hypothetical protein
MSKDLQAICDVWFGEYVPIVCDLEGEWNDFPFPSNYPNPESLTIVKDEFEHLSKEAKEVVGLIYNAPYTIMELFSTRKKKNITARSLELFLVESGWTKFKTKKVLNELTNFAQNL